MITALYAGLLALIFLALSLRVVARRRAEKINLGDGEDRTMLWRIRAQANFSEYVPLLVILLGMLEYNGVSSAIIHALGTALVIARAMHGYSLSVNPKFFFGRFWGTVLTFVLLLGMGLACIVMGLIAI